MAWVTLSLRKKELKREHTNYQLRDLQISREKRKLARRKQYEQSLIQTKQKEALAPIKQIYADRCTELRKNQKALNEYLNAVTKIVNDTSGSVVERNGNVYQKSDYGTYVHEMDGQADTFNPTSEYSSYVEDDGTMKFKKNDMAVAVEMKSDDKTAQYYDMVFDSAKYQSVISEFGLASFADIKADPSSVNVSDIKSKISTELNQITTDLQVAYTEYVGNQDTEKQIYEDELEMLESEVADEELLLDEEQTDVETQMEAISQELEAVAQAISSGIQQSVIHLS